MASEDMRMLEHLAESLRVITNPAERTLPDRMLDQMPVTPVTPAPVASTLHWQPHLDQVRVGAHAMIARQPPAGYMPTWRRKTRRDPCARTRGGGASDPWFRVQFRVTTSRTNRPPRMSDLGFPGGVFRRFRTRKAGLPRGATRARRTWRELRAASVCRAWATSRRRRAARRPSRTWPRRCRRRPCGTRHSCMAKASPTSCVLRRPLAEVGVGSVVLRSGGGEQRRCSAWGMNAASV
jgi:hypothetical protein